FNNFRFKYVLINPEKFFGYRKERIGDLDFLIAEEEKAIIDSLYLPENAGGMAEVIKAVYNAKDKVDPDKLFAYASAMKNRSLCSRLGYLLERFGAEAGMLLECSSNEYVRLDPAREKSRVWDKKWHVNVNLRGESVSEDRITVRTEYDDVKTFVISAASPDHVFAEKVQALLVRGKARDLYDLWFLMERGIKPDLELINSKLSLYDKTFSRDEMNKRIAELEKSWTKDLRPLLGTVVPYDAAAKKVVDGLS
ncbi:MAG: nucleotidyl transferase AbiEii/AbiGii toxin family protein, partial [Methanobacteriota archaeon]